MKRWWCVAALCLLGAAGPALAQDEPRGDELKKMYDQALDQLKSAQQRKNQLATDNDRLKGKLAAVQQQLDAANAAMGDLHKQLDVANGGLGDLQRQLDGANLTLADLRREASAFAERTYYLRSHYAAWQEFMELQPELASRWNSFLEDGPSALPDDMRQLLEPHLSPTE